MAGSATLIGTVTTPGNNINVTMSANANAVHVVCLGSDWTGSSVAWTPPAGWVLVSSTRFGNSTSDCHGVMYAYAGYNANDTLTFSADNSYNLGAVYLQLEGVSLSDMVHDGDHNEGAAASVTSVAVSGVNCDDDEAIVAMHVTDGGDLMGGMGYSFSNISVSVNNVTIQTHTTGSGVAMNVVYGVCTNGDNSGGVTFTTTLSDGMGAAMASFNPGGAWGRDGVDAASEIDGVTSIGGLDGVT